MKHVLHSLSRLTCGVNQIQQFEFRLLDVQVFVEGRSFAPLRHNSQLGFADAAHKQQDVDVSISKS